MNIPVDHGHRHMCFELRLRRRLLVSGVRSCPRRYGIGTASFPIIGYTLLNNIFQVLSLDKIMSIRVSWVNLRAVIVVSRNRTG